MRDRFIVFIYFQRHLSLHNNVRSFFSSPTPGVSLLPSLTSLYSSFLAAFALPAPPALRLFSKYFHFFVFFFGAAVFSVATIFFLFYIASSLLYYFLFLSLSRIGSLPDSLPLTAAAAPAPPPPPLHCSPSAHNSLSPQIRSLFTGLA